MNEDFLNRFAIARINGMNTVQDIKFLVENYIYDRLEKVVKINEFSIMTQPVSTNNMVTYAMDWYAQRFNISYFL